MTAAFTLILGAVALAVGLAFGLGNRELAGEITRRWYEEGQRRDRRRTDRQGPNTPPGGRAADTGLRADGRAGRRGGVKREAMMQACRLRLPAARAALLHLCTSSPACHALLQPIPPHRPRPVRVLDRRVDRPARSEPGQRRSRRETPPRAATRPSGRTRRRPAAHPPGARGRWSHTSPLGRPRAKSNGGFGRGEGVLDRQLLRHAVLLALLPHLGQHPVLVGLGHRLPGELAVLARRSTCRRAPASRPGSPGRAPPRRVPLASTPKKSFGAKTVAACCTCSPNLASPNSGAARLRDRVHLARLPVRSAAPECCPAPGARPAAAAEQAW